MSKPIVHNVFEFDKLIIGEQFSLKQWEAFVRLNQDHGNRYFDILHNGIRFRQFVGVIRVGNCTVNIHPKADRQESETKWKSVLLHLLKTCGRLPNETVGKALLRKQQVDLLEVYFDRFLTGLEELNRAGWVKRYRIQSGNVSVLKGRLDFTQNLRHNLVRQDRFFTRHQVYDHDHLLHQLLYCALLVVQKLSAGSSWSDRCGRLKLGFPEVTNIKPTPAMIHSIRLDRKTSVYADVWELAKLILLNYSPDIHQGNMNMIALLFDMNVLWEEYVLVHLRKYCRLHSEWSVAGQISKPFHGLYRTLRPDIVLQKSEQIFVIDTKWKLPEKNEASTDDLRQMYAYARFWQSERVTLLYPGNNQTANYLPFHNQLKDGMEHQCQVARISIFDENGKLAVNLGRTIIDIIESK